MRRNVATPRPPLRTHEGAIATRANAVQQLRRTVLACLLGENQFYESGVSIEKRLSEHAKAVSLQDLATLAIEARTVYRLRHAPLRLLVSLLEREDRKGCGSLIEDTITTVLMRADEPGELLALWWGGASKTRPVPAALKRGLARALQGFNEYKLAKYDRDSAAVKLRDVLFLVHAKPKDKAQAKLFKRLAAREMATPDTWETELSAGKDKNATFTRLLIEEKLGYLALLRNLRNMMNAGVDRDLIEEAIVARKGAQHVFPFRYVAAARVVPVLEPTLDRALLASLEEMTPLRGRTIVLVDVSGSMDDKLSGKSDLTRLDAAATLAAIIPGKVDVYTFSERVVQVPARKGMAGIEAIVRSQPHGGTALAGAIRAINQMEHDRLIVITDEQSQDGIAKPVAEHAYLINVASARNGVAYGKEGWLHLTGFSENVLRYIAAFEDALEVDDAFFAPVPPVSPTSKLAKQRARR